MKHLNDESYESNVISRLDVLRETSPRNPASVRSGKGKFLAEARQVKLRTSQKPVSETLSDRLNGWILSIQNSLHHVRRKERFSMMTTVITIIVAISVLFGGAGATVFAAQDANPNQPLYEVKLLAEDVRMSLTNNMQERLALALRYADNRMDEMAALVGESEAIPEPLATRYRDHLNYAFQLAASNDDGNLRMALNQIRNTMEQHHRMMIQIQTNIPDYADPVMNQMRNTIRARLQVIDLGLEDPVWFRLNLHQQLQNNGEMPAGDPANGDQPGPGNDQAPGNQNGDPTGDGNMPGPGGKDQTPLNDQEPPIKNSDTTPEPFKNSEGPEPQAGTGEPTSPPNQNNDSSNSGQVSPTQDKQKDQNPDQGGSQPPSNNSGKP